MKPLCRPSYGCLAKITFLIWVASSLLALPRFSIILSHLLLEVGEPDFRSIILPLVHKTFNHSNHFDRPISSAGPSQRSTPFKRLKEEEQGNKYLFLLQCGKLISPFSSSKFSNLIILGSTAYWYGPTGLKANRRGTTGETHHHHDAVWQVQLLVHHLHLCPSSDHHGGLLFKDVQVANDMRIQWWWSSGIYLEDNMAILIGATETLCDFVIWGNVSWHALVSWRLENGDGL